MFRTWRRRQWLGSRYRQSISRFASTLVTRRSYPTSPARSLNRLTILFYSSIISTAAAADSVTKQKRRRHWDIAFAQLEESLQSPTHQTPFLHSPPISDSNNSQSNKAGVDGQNFQEQSEANDQVTKYSKSSFLELLRLQGNSTSDLSRKTTPCQVEEYFFQSPGGVNILAEKIHSKSRVSHSSIYASSFRRTSRVSVWTPKKHVRVEYSVAKLAIRFMMKARRRMSSNIVETQKLEETLREISNRLEIIFTVDAFDFQGHVKRLQYPEYTHGVVFTDKDRSMLHKVLAGSIRRYALGKDSYEILLLKIAYYLLTSRVPPNTTTYNLLISRFNRLRLHHPVNAVIQSMFECYMRPDEISATAILYHCIRTRNRRKFREIVRKIQGFGGGLMLARPGVRTDGVGSSRLHQRKNKIVQALTIDPQMANLIVRGYLQFGNEASAFSWLNKMQEQGMQPDIRTLNALIQYYTRCLKWEPGILIWDQIFTHFFSSDSCEYITPEDSALAFYSALELCKACRQSKNFCDIYRDGLSRGIPMTKLLRLSSTSRGFSYFDDVIQVRNRTLRILEHRVALLIEDNRKWALHVLASKMILSNLCLADLEAMFQQFRRRPWYLDWLKDRPWFFKEEKLRTK